MNMLSRVKMASGSLALVAKQLLCLEDELTRDEECGRKVELSEDGRNRTIMTIADQHAYMDEWAKERSDAASLS